MSEFNAQLSAALTPISEADSLVRSAVLANADTQKDHARQAEAALKAAARILAKVR